MTFDPVLQFMVMVVLPLMIFIVGAIWGHFAQKRHIEDLEKREKRYSKFPVHNGRKPPEGYEVSRAALVMGSVVISEDVLKRLFARLRNLFGGNIKSYESLLNRARREACLRMIQDAEEGGSDAVINVRYDTAGMGAKTAERSSPVGVEVLVFGTGIKLRKA